MSMTDKQRAKNRLAPKKVSEATKVGEGAASSFRLGRAHIERLRLLSQRSDMSKTDILRMLIDKEFDAVRESRRRPTS